VFNRDEEMDIEENAKLRKSLDIYTSARPAISGQKVSLNKL
jgi:hypothetical protein